MARVLTEQNWIIPLSTFNVPSSEYFTLLTVLECVCTTGSDLFRGSLRFGEIRIFKGSAQTPCFCEPPAICHLAGSSDGHRGCFKVLA